MSLPHTLVLVLPGLGRVDQNPGSYKPHTETQNREACLYLKTGPTGGIIAHLELGQKRMNMVQGPPIGE
jgi:hypothetical protein